MPNANDATPSGVQPDDEKSLDALERHLSLAGGPPFSNWSRALKALRSPAKMKTPALDFVLGFTDYNGRDVEKPMFCAYFGIPCPFGSLVEPYHEIANDESEAHYDCTLTGNREWGENPSCTGAQWRAKAREEFHALCGRRDDGRSTAAT